MFKVSPFTTALSPVENVPADHSVPPVLSLVALAPLPKQRNAPLTVPVLVTANDSAADSAFDPAVAADHTAVLRLPLYVGAFVPPASSHPACDAIVSPAATAVYDVAEIRPMNGPTTV